MASPWSSDNIPEVHLLMIIGYLYLSKIGRVTVKFIKDVTLLQ